MLDKLHPEVRHIVLILIVVALTWLAASIPALNLDPLWAPLAGGAVTAPPANGAQSGSRLRAGIDAASQVSATTIRIRTMCRASGLSLSSIIPPF